MVRLPLFAEVLWVCPALVSQPMCREWTLWGLGQYCALQVIENYELSMSMV